LVPTISGFRAACTSGPLLLGLAFFGGIASALWAVALPPVVAQLTDETNRAFAFSVVFASGIGFGILAGLVGGHLPSWLLPLSWAHTAVSGKRAALLFACALAALAVWPASRLKFPSTPVAEKKHYPRNPFVVRFFPALAVWSFATGAFNPFFNAYFAHGLGFPVERIGTIFSGAHLAQVLAILAAPAVFRRFGLLAGILYTQVACGAALEWLAAGPHGQGTAIAFACFTSFQWMSEPGMYTLLMSKVRPDERAGASALNLLVIAGSQAIAAAVAGQAFARFGYPSVMTAIGATIFVAAVLFRFRLSGSEAPRLSAQTAIEAHQGGVA
jgi:predicted MFS family arabinose efflux permease